LTRKTIGVKTIGPLMTIGLYDWSAGDRRASEGNKNGVDDGMERAVLEFEPYADM